SILGRWESVYEPSWAARGGVASDPGRDFAPGIIRAGAQGGGMGDLVLNESSTTASRNCATPCVIVGFLPADESSSVIAAKLECQATLQTCQGRDGCEDT